MADAPDICHLHTVHFAGLGYANSAATLPKVGSKLTPRTS